MIQTVAIIDTETTGLDPKVHRVVEIGCVLWSVKYACVISAWSDLVQGEGNEAEKINRIPATSLHLGISRNHALNILQSLVYRADLVVAHRAEFDASFLPELRMPWVCSKFDIEWPCSKLGDDLVHVALAHDVPVTGAHRALTDCFLLARIFEAAHRGGSDIQAMLARAMRPKCTVQALVSYDARESAKQAGFAWEPATKRWLRRIALEDVAALPFQTRMVEP